MKNNTDFIDWANDWLKFNGYSLQNAPEILLETPWSNVVKFSTVKEDLYLKQTASLIYVEAAIIKLLANKFNANVANLIATNEKLHCFLMLDAGPTLRKYLKSNFDPNLIREAIAQFAFLQRSIENNLESFFELGVPDWRLDKLPGLYDQIINQTDLLIASGLTDDELQILQGLRKKVVEQCSLLSQYKIPETLVQPDCNTNNILINTNTKEMTIIDLGEIAIAHPFLSLGNFLYQTTIHEGIKEQDTVYNQIQDVYLDHWSGSSAKSQLLDIMQLIKKIHPIYNVLFHYRLMLFVDLKDYDLYYANKTNQIARYFREYIEINPH